MRFTELSQWLQWLNELQLSAVDLKPGRFAEVAARLGIDKPQCPVVTVAGTNGKGSVVALLESILISQGHQVAAFTSPYLIDFNEQIRFASRHISADDLCRLFCQVDEGRENTPLTLFEFKTLAAFLYFQEQEADVWLLEVGLGGRLDPVNYISADIAVITSVGLDHCELLGYTRAEIAREKSGIMRDKQRVICGEIDPPPVIFDCAKACNAQVFFVGKDFSYEVFDHHWNWHYSAKELLELPHSVLLDQNAATALMTIEALQNYLVVEEESIRKGLKKAFLPGRLQVIESDPTLVLDVAHNPDSVQVLRQYLEDNSVAGRTHAVFSMLRNKDIVQTIEIIKSQVDCWYIAALDDYRGASASELTHAFEALEMNNVQQFPMMGYAFAEARNRSRPGDRVIVFGSFSCVSEVLEAF